ncbi:efflux RND transporter periplasmic adaptor subunit [Pseudoxanthomonas sp. F37]|uniref:efflux RND transporter periplasmic adaptor subunit n=1 Tax=Pseudoxanthomonas TaxID=83618 RepID=UPI001FD472F7|nr:MULTISPECIES: efflux RND transporter periplasmic adaptor subunit [Pseudoxanthomonas]UOV06738.1 efflux RND transporter periplasmic adaptor subunit [Pseudoxanthomonas mexicana]UOV08351.1 efflux RND transporter periplasmic adaptor subunit [Pseudoxanthomonas sp. F37]
MRHTRWNGVFVVLMAGLAACSADTPAESPRPALVVQPGGGADAALSAYAGEVRAREESPLSFRVGGNLIRRNVDAGARVQKGEVLALLDPGDFALQAQAAQAQLAAAEADLARARGDRDRYAKLVGDQLISRSAYDAQVAAYKAAEGQARAARAQMDVMRNQEGYSQLRAPRDGVIASRQAEAGQVVAAGQTIFTLAADGGREVAIGLPENRIREFSVGQAVMIELWNAPGQRLPGTIREIAPAADAQTRTYATRVSLVGDAVQQVELGQSARVYVQENGAKAALKLPLSAVQRGEDGKTSVWIVDPATGEVRARSVQLGRYGESSVPVLAGLKASEWVVAAGGHLLREGQTVAPVDRNNRPLKPAAGGGAANIASRPE